MNDSNDSNGFNGSQKMEAISKGCMPHIYYTFSLTAVFYHTGAAMAEHGCEQIGNRLGQKATRKRGSAKHALSLVKGAGRERRVTPNEDTTHVRLGPQPASTAHVLVRRALSGS